MAKMFQKIKSSIGKIHWPSIKEVLGDTTFTVVVGTALAIMISLWISGIEIVVNWVMLLF